MSALYLSRATLRHDVPAASLAPILAPGDVDGRTHLGHRLIWTLFSESVKRDFLWREEGQSGLGQGRFMMLSSSPPKDEHRLFNLDSKPFEPTLKSGDRLGFSLRANPVVSRKIEAGRRGKRHDVVMDALKEAPDGERAEARRSAIMQSGTRWLVAQAERNGFEMLELPPLRIDGYERIQVPRRRTEKPMIFGRLDFDGALQVTDPQTFLRALALGFGKARGFGCGLMLIRRI